MHVRTQIRNAVVDTLAGLTTTGANVFPSRVHAMPDKVLPGLLVYADGEESEPSGTGPARTLDRELDLVVEGKAKAGADIDDVLDTIAEEVEAAMDANRKLGGLCLESYLASTELALSGEGRRRAGSVKMTFKIFYSA